MGEKINFIVRGAYLTAALGGKKLKNKSTATRRMRLPDGTLTDNEDIQTTVSEIEQAPNMQALSTWPIITMKNGTRLSVSWMKKRARYTPTKALILTNGLKTTRKCKRRCF